MGLTAAVLSLASFGGAHAMKDGEDLQEKCRYLTAERRDRGDFDDIGQCLDFIKSVTPLLNSRSDICVPAGTVLGDFHYAVRVYLAKYPMRLQQNPSVLIVDAIAEAYPCPARK